jgi:hypothetical protein
MTLRRRHDKLAALNRAHPAVTRQQQPDLQLGLPAVELLRKGGPRLQHALITTSAKKLAKVEHLDAAVKQLQKKRSFSNASQLMAALKKDAQLGGWEGPQGCYAALATLWKAHSCLQMHCQRGMLLLVGLRVGGLPGNSCLAPLLSDTSSGQASCSCAFDVRHVHRRTMSGQSCCMTSWQWL